jgi:hypothetical protein
VRKQLVDITYEQLHKTFEDVSEQLEKAGLKTTWYTIPNMYGYESQKQNRLSETFCLEAHLGPSYIEGFETYAVAQLFSAAYPSLAVTFLIERRKANNSLSTHLPIFNAKNDKAFSGIFLPAMYKAFNHLDPSGGQRGLLVQLYNGKMSLGDFIQASVYTIRLVTRFKKEGQLALIAVDFNDPLIRFIARLSDPVAAWLASDVHQIPSTDKPSKMSIPIRDGQEGYRLVTCTTAFDEGIALAMSYLDNHYQPKL